MTRLRKAEIISGAEHSELLPVKALDGEVMVRPLTQKECGKVQALLIGEQTVSGRPGEEADQISMQLGSILTGMAEAERMLVAFALSCEGDEWTTDEVGDLPDEVVSEIARKVDGKFHGGNLLEGGDGADRQLAARFRGDA